DPPPTSATATGPSPFSSDSVVAPRNDISASASSDRIWSGKPVRSMIFSASSPVFGAVRRTAVPTIVISRAPSRRAVDTCAATASAVSWIFAVDQEGVIRSEEHTSELQSPYDLVCRLLLEKKNAGYHGGRRRCRRQGLRYH